jgi:hypothetical protein
MRVVVVRVVITEAGGVIVGNGAHLLRSPEL